MLRDLNGLNIDLETLSRLFVRCLDVSEQKRVSGVLYNCYRFAPPPHPISQQPRVPGKLSKMLKNVSNKPCKPNSICCRLRTTEYANAFFCPTLVKGKNTNVPNARGSDGVGLVSSRKIKKKKK